MDMRSNGNHTENEIKFIISNYRSKPVLAWLKAMCRPDPLYPAAIVSSIYFDTWNWRSLGEKINSDYLKSKIRLRWYSDTDLKQHGPVSFAEAKFKIGYKRKKVRVSTPFSGAWLSNIHLENVLLHEIPRLLQSKGVALDRHYYPAFQIRYKRHRFVEPNSGLRICFDSDIAVPRVNCMMLPKHNPFALHTSVFEVKGDSDKIPYPLFPLMRMGFKKASFSKYGVCFEKLVGI
jgi:SPX domain protein involved in polyphosphate accumulation